MTRFRITVLPAALALAAGAFVPALSAPQAARAGQHRVAAVTPGQQLWVQRYHGPQMPANFPAGAALSPDGTKVFVTGTSSASGKQEYATVAYRAATGARLWMARYPGKWFLTSASSIAVSPGGRLVFVTGRSTRSGTTTDYTTVAYRAATGAKVWAARYNGPASRDDTATSVAVSPRGNVVFVTGFGQGTASGRDYATVAYRADTGTQLWAKRYNVTGSSVDTAAALAVSPNGQTVFVTGYTFPPRGHADYVTIAYLATTGKLRWHARYNGPGNGDDIASSVKITPDGGTVLVTGTSYGGPGVGSDWATVAYRVATGAQRWVSRYNGPGNGDDGASSLAVGPRGTNVYVTGFSTGKTSGRDSTTVAYRTATGAQVWAKRYSGPGNRADSGSSIATSPDGSKVFATGTVTGAASDGDYLTIGYRAATGAWLWGSRYNGPANTLDRANTVVTSATRVIVTGDSFQVLGNPGTSDYATIGYAP
jgi:hypothetical protein